MLLYNTTVSTWTSQTAQQLKLCTNWRLIRLCKVNVKCKQVCRGCLTSFDALARRALGRERVFRRRADLLAETDERLLSGFRLPVLLQICNLLEPQLRRQTGRSNPIPPHVHVLTSSRSDSWPHKLSNRRQETDVQVFRESCAQPWSSKSSSGHHSSIPIHLHQTSAN